MALVSDSELRTFTTVGAQDAASRTYLAVQAALSRWPALQPYDYEVFLQGSYANHTNTRGDSDVDVVAMLKNTFEPDISRLSPPEIANYSFSRSPAVVTAGQFREGVHAALVSCFGSSRVHARDKCIRVDKVDGYVDADVVPSLQHRLYTAYPPFGAPQYIEGISIRPLSGGSIVNYPKRHKSNGEKKNSECSNAYKPSVRQVKRLRRRAVDWQLLGKTDAPGYLLECMIYNVPQFCFLGDEASRVHGILEWLGQFSSNEFRREMWSCDKIHHLFVDDPGSHSADMAAHVVDVLRRLI